MTLGPLMVDLRGSMPTREEVALLRLPAVGGVILFRRNFESKEQLEVLVREIHAVRSPELLVAVDQEGGRVQRFQDPFTLLPPPRQLGHRYDEDPPAAISASRELGWLMAAELRSVGVDFSFAPVVDRDMGLSAVIGDRALHDNPEVVAELASAYVAGMDKAGMAAVAKHFPTHSGVQADSHTEVATDPRPLEELLDDIDIYRRLVAAGIAGVMMAHVRFPMLDPVPAGFSPWWVRKLRRELDFHGAIISDDLSMAGAAEAGDLTARAHRALEAGCDMVLTCNQPDALLDLARSLSSFSRPESQLRLMRLRGDRKRGQDWEALRHGEHWKLAARLANELTAPPPLSLEG